MTLLEWVIILIPLWIIIFLVGIAFIRELHYRRWLREYIAEREEDRKNTRVSEPWSRPPK